MSRIRLLALWLLAAVCAVINLALMLIYALAVNQRALHVWYGIDGATNAAFGGAEDVTLSARAGLGRAAGKTGWKWLADFLDWLMPGHCAAAIANDRAEAHRVLTQLI